MRRIIFGLVFIIGASAAITAGATGAYFSDTENSIGNFFTAGAIDLKIDNDSYYNGNFCQNIGTVESPNFVWQGSAAFPVPGTPCDTTWLPDDLNDGLTTLHKFFNFTDIKPDDEGEDTISLDVENDAWVCMNVALTSNNDNTCSEPENAANAENGQCTEPNANAWDGELAQSIQMFWWADDGDNVYEIGEPGISGGVKTLYNLATTSPFQVAIADATHNVWGTPGPVPANVTKYIAKAWCFGTLVEAPLAQSAGNPQVNTGFTCNGTTLGNQTQTDEATLDVSFSATQARHNSDFLCNPPTTATITVHKTVVPGNDPTPATPATFAPYQISGVGNVILDTPVVVTPVSHTISENAAADLDYTQTFTGDCAPNGTIGTVVAGQNYNCTIVNTYAPRCVFNPDLNLVTNGGFETPEVTDAAQWDIFPSVAGGWTVVWRSDVPANFGGGSRPATANLELHEGVLGAAFQGDQYAELDSDWNGHVGTLNNEPAATSIYQDLTTVAGATYNVYFAFAPRPSTDAATNRLEVQWGGGVIHDTGSVGDANAGIGWTVIGPIAVVATTTTTRIRFNDLGVADSLGTFLDDVRVFQTGCGPGTNNFLTPGAPPLGAASFFSDGFGTGSTDSTFDEAPAWTEGGTGGATKRAIGAGDDTASANGGRFAAMTQAGFICRSIDATGEHTMDLSYLWRGDSQAEAADSGLVQYATGGTCAAPTGLTTVATHVLTNTAWTANSLNLPATLNGTTFFLFFRNVSSAADEDFRVDGVNLNGISI